MLSLVNLLPKLNLPTGAVCRWLMHTRLLLPGIHTVFCHAQVGLLTRLNGVVIGVVCWLQLRSTHLLHTWNTAPYYLLTQADLPRIIEELKLLRVYLNTGILCYILLLLHSLINNALYNTMDPAWQKLGRGEIFCSSYNPTVYFNVLSGVLDPMLFW